MKESDLFDAEMITPLVIAFVAAVLLVTALCLLIVAGDPRAIH